MTAPIRTECKVLDLSLSNVCVNRCLFCGDVRRDVPVMTTAEVMEKLQGCRLQGYDGVEFSSKEFTLRKDAVEILEAARDLGFRMIHLVTNGHLFSDYAAASRFLDSGITKLSLSFHSDDERVEAAVTGNPASFRNKVAAVKNILRSIKEKQRRCLFFVNTTMTPLTVGRMDHIMTFIVGLGVRRHNLHFPRLQPHMLDDFDRTVPRYGDLCVPLSNGLDLWRPRRIQYAVVDVPPCIVPNHANLIGERLKNDKKDVFKGRHENDDYDARHEKVKGEACSACLFSDRCAGVFARYVERRGWEEFRPILNGPRPVS